VQIDLVLDIAVLIFSWCKDHSLGMVIQLVPDLVSSGVSLNHLFLVILEAGNLSIPELGLSCILCWWVCTWSVSIDT